MSAKTIIEKIWDRHAVTQQEGHPAVFAIDLQMIHEVTSAQAFENLRKHSLPMAELGHCLATLDHSISTADTRETLDDSAASKQVMKLRENCKEFGVPLMDFGSGHQGIVHVIGPELGITQPGMTIVCGDSHTATHGAFGALAFGVGTTEVGLVMATGCLLQHKPKTMKVEFAGSFKPGVFAKDAILKLISEIGIGGANGHIIEYTGDAIRSMNMEERMTVCNMSIECGARAGLVAPDQTTYDWIQGTAYGPKDGDWDRAVGLWESLKTDDGAQYDRELVIDVSQLDPMVTWGTNPGQGTEITKDLPYVIDLHFSQHINAQKALEYTGLEEGQNIEGVPIDWAFLGSCTNARLSDLRLAAKMIEGKKVADGVTFFVVPGSESVREQAEKEGLDTVFKEAGAIWRQPGCSSCLAMNDDKVPEGKRCISSSNRNFVGRQGTGSITHLASPATVTASAIAGTISSPVSYFA